MNAISTNVTTAELRELAFHDLEHSLATLRKSAEHLNAESPLVQHMIGAISTAETSLKILAMTPNGEIRALPGPLHGEDDGDFTASNVVVHEAPAAATSVTSETTSAAPSSPEASTSTVIPRAMDLVLTVNVKDLRESMGLSRGAFAKKLGVARGSVVNWEDNGVKPQQKYATKLMDMASKADGVAEKAEETPASESPATEKATPAYATAHADKRHRCGAYDLGCTREKKFVDGNSNGRHQQMCPHFQTARLLEAGYQIETIEDYAKSLKHSLGGKLPYKSVENMRKLIDSKNGSYRKVLLSVRRGLKNRAKGTSTNAKGASTSTSVKPSSVSESVLNVKTLRESLGLSRGKFAKKIGASRGSVVNWENGAKPQAKYFAKLTALAASSEKTTKAAKPTTKATKTTRAKKAG